MSQERITDLLTNILHLSNSKGFDFDKALAMARIHFEAECNSTSNEHVGEEGLVGYLNKYRCPNDDCEWADEADCQCNDRCPVCNKEIEPYTSIDIVIL